MKDYNQNAMICLEAAKENPYDNRGDKNPFRMIARAIAADCLDRRDIKNVLRRIDDDVRQEIIDAWATIILASLTSRWGGEDDE